LAVRNDLTFNKTLSPRIVTVAAPSTKLSVQDLVDTCRDFSDEIENMEAPHFIDAAGKEPLGGGVYVGITATLQNAKVAFEARNMQPIASGICTTASSAGDILIDAAATFTSGIDTGALVVNWNDRSTGTIVRIDSDSQMFQSTLQAGFDNQWEVGDNYTVYNVIQCEVAGGNLVAVDAVGSGVDAIHPTAFTQIIRTSGSSATLQELEAIQYSSFAGGVSIDITSSLAGTDFPAGTQEFPVNNVSDAMVIASTRGFDTLFITGPVTLTTGHDVSNLVVCGTNVALSSVTVLVGATTVGTTFRDLTLTGVLDGDSLVTGCHIGNLDYVEGLIDDCLLLGTITLAGTSATTFLDCSDGIAGVGIPTIDMGGSGRNLVIRGYEGGLKRTNLTGAQEASINITPGRLVIDSTVTAGSFLVKGVGLVQDNSGPGATVDINGVVSPGLVSDATWDEAAVDHTAAGTMGALQNTGGSGGTSTVSGIYTLHQFYNYDNDADILTGVLWTQDSTNVVFSGSFDCTADFYTDTGSHLFKMIDSTPDPRGTFRVQKTSAGLTVGDLYYSTASVTVASGIIASSNYGFTLTSSGIVGGGTGGTGQPFDNIIEVG
jgi:hypothetical protein